MSAWQFSLLCFLIVWSKAHDPERPARDYACGGFMMLTWVLLLWHFGEAIIAFIRAM